MDPESSSKYKQFKQWFTENGGLFNKIQFPSRFPPIDYIGVAAASDIKANETFLAIPKKLIISVTKVKQSALGSVLSQYKSLSDPDTQETQFNILALYLIWQKMLGQVSFFHPYLQVVDKAETIMQWSDEDIRKMKDPYITLELVEEMRQQFPVIYEQFHKLSISHPELFKQPISFDLFMECYTLVMTRCFGWGLPETMMVPFADFLNHNCGGVNHYVFNRKLEDSIPQYEKYRKVYIKKRKQIDLGLLGINNKSELPISYMRNARQDFIHKNQKLLTQGTITHPYNPLSRLSTNINREHLQAIQKKLLFQDYNIPLFPSSNSEDNDTDQQSENEKQRLFSKQIKRLSRQQIQKRYEEPKPLANSQFQEDVSFDWWEELSEDQTYFIMVAQRNIDKGQQIYNSYGRRSNRFLLTWYGFTHLNNKYDSVCFRLFDQSSSLKSGKLLFAKYITSKSLANQSSDYENLNITDEFRLKRDNLCFQLITYLRLRIARSTQPFTDLYKKKLLLIHKISNLELEKLALCSYQTILKELQIQYAIHQTRQKLQNELHDYFAYILIESNKEIITNHRNGVRALIGILDRVGDGEELLSVYQTLGSDKEGKKKVLEELGWRERRFILDYVKMLGNFLSRKGKK